MTRDVYGNDITPACLVVKDAMRQADKNMRKALKPKPAERRPVTYHGVTVNTHARAEARRKMKSVRWTAAPAA